MELVDMEIVETKDPSESWSYSGWGCSRFVSLCLTRLCRALQLAGHLHVTSRGMHCRLSFTSHNVFLVSCSTCLTVMETSHWEQENKKRKKQNQNFVLQDTTWSPQEMQSQMQSQGDGGLEESNVQSSLSTNSLAWGSEITSWRGII